MKQRKAIAILAMVLVLVLAIGLFAACNKETNDTIVIGSTTELSGDFRWPGLGGSSAGASDQDIAKLTTGYSTMDSDRYGKYVWNQTSVKSHSEVETKDGTYLITIEMIKC